MWNAEMLNAIQTLRSNGIVVNNSHHTRSVVHNLKYLWKIDNYRYHHEKKSCLETPVFTADTNREYRWYLTLQRTPPCNNEDVMGIFWFLDASSKCKKAFVKYKFSIMDEEFKANNVSVEQKVRRLKADGTGWGFLKFISIDDFSNEKKWFPNNGLTIYCELTFSETEEFIKTADELSSDLNQRQLDRPNCCISKDFGDLFKNEKLTDVTLSVNGKEYRVHKVVLAARSPVFAAMFEHNTKENETNLVEITDIEGNVVEEMLRYIYTDKCENLTGVAGGLLAASDKYDLKGLKIICEEVLINNLTVENAAETLNLANLHCATELKSKAINFVVANSVEILDTDNWKKASLLYPQSLLVEILNALSRHFSASIN